VTIKNSIVRGGPQTKNGAMISNYTSGLPFTVLNSELVASHPSPYVNGILGSNFTARGVKIHDVIDGIHIIGDNVTVEDSWIYDNLHFLVDPNHKGTPSHDDTIQIQQGKNIRIANNHMTGPHNAIVQITQDRGVVSDITFTKNVVDNGFCSINIAQKTYGPIARFAITDNTFGRNTSHPNCAIVSPLTTTPLLTLANNTWADNGKAISITRGK
jgi:hypothetical protein